MEGAFYYSNAHLTFVQSLESPFPRLNNRDPTDEESMKAIKNIRNNKASLVIEDEFLKIGYFLHEFNNNFLYYIKKR